MEVTLGTSKYGRGILQQTMELITREYMGVIWAWNMVRIEIFILVLY